MVSVNHGRLGGLVADGRSHVGVCPVYESWIFGVPGAGPPNQLAAEQKAMIQAEQQAIAAQAAEEKRKHDAHVKANRARIERDAQRREAAIAKRKAENALKGGSSN